MATPELIRAHYDSLALVYRAFWGDHIHHGLFERGDETPAQAQSALVDYCLALARPAAGCAVLDVGCGHGAVSVRLARELQCNVVALTLSGTQACLARETATESCVQKQVDFLVQDAETYTYPSCQFDLVWTMESSEHFRDKQRYLRNVAATLKRDGRLLLTAWTGTMESPCVRAVAAASLCPSLWTAEQYCAAITGTGMQLLYCQDLSAKVARTWQVCGQRARAARAAVCLLPRPARDFVEAIDLIIAAYDSGELGYTVISAVKPAGPAEDNNTVLTS
jgi:tocopherol O-methyltransferase